MTFFGLTVALLVGSWQPGSGRDLGLCADQWANRSPLVPKRKAQTAQSNEALCKYDDEDDDTLLLLVFKFKLPKITRGIAKAHI